MTGGPAPQGYFVSGKTPWGEIIAEGVKAGRITLRGEDAQAETSDTKLNGSGAARQRQAQSELA